MRNPAYKHGLYGSKTYNSWWAMKQRCTYPKHIEFHRYGARGIQVCDKWMTFEGFLADMGERPPGTSLDRINNNGHYEAGNCRWATKLEQANNCRSNHVLEYDGKRMTIAQWGRAIGLSPLVISKRLRRGWDTARALSTPLLSTR